MKPKTKDLTRIAAMSKDMKEQASRVTHNVLTRRVTHTLSGMKRLVNYVTQMRKGLQDNKDFVKPFEFALYQCQNGPTEFEPHNDGRSVFIRGSFDIEMLREFFVVNEPPGMITLDVEGPRNGQATQG